MALRALFRGKRDLLTSLGIWCPASSALDAGLAEVGLASPVPPLSVAEALAHLDPAVAPHEDLARARPVVEAFVSVSSAPPPRQPEAPAVARLAGADSPLSRARCLRHIDLTIREGEILGILGANGAGKSTLGLCLAGLLELKAGERTGAPGGFAFQRPENQFVAGSVRDEILAALPKQMAAAARAEQVAKALAAWGARARTTGIRSICPRGSSDDLRWRRSPPPIAGRCSSWTNPWRGSMRMAHPR